MDEPLVWYEGAGTSDRRWLVADQLGSVIASTDASGTTTRYAYGPYGEPASWAGGRFRYTGQAALPEAQLYHYKARVYDPILGRFLQTDPVGYFDSYNLYQYALNDPLNRVDPTGLANCPGDDPSCVETPESAQQPGDPPPRSDETQQEEVIVVTAHRQRREPVGDWPGIPFDDGQEHGYYVQGQELVPAVLRHLRDVECPGGTSVSLNGLTAPAGATRAHSHPDSYGPLGSVPGPGDNRAAVASNSHTAFTMTSNNVFTIESFANGTFRTTVSGPALSGSQRADLVANMQVWENPSAQAATSDQDRYCPH